MQKDHRKLVEHHSHIPLAASQAVDKALSSEPEQRFGDCQSFADAFLRGLRTEASIATEPSIRKEEAGDGTRELDLKEYRKNLQEQSAHDQSLDGGGLDIAGSIDAGMGRQGSSTPIQRTVTATTFKDVLIGGAVFAMLGLVCAFLVWNDIGILGGNAVDGGSKVVNAESDLNEVSDVGSPQPVIEKQPQNGEGNGKTESSVEREKELKKGAIKEKELLAQAAEKARLEQQAKLEQERTAEQKIEREKIETEFRKAGNVNSIGMPFQLISAGRFMMGSPENEPGHKENEFLHEVRLTSDFYLGRFEVTQGQWKTVMGTQPWKGEREGREGAKYPAVYISWDEATEFCRRLSKRDGVLYRLPTEAEWEYACRGGTDTAFSFGTAISIVGTEGIKATNGIKDLGKYAWFKDNAWDAGEKYAHKVGQKLPNGFGLHDMHGNVWEWCGDWYSDDYYSKSSKRDPTGPEDGTGRVSRGGSCVNSPQSCRSAARTGFLPDSRNFSLGFRVLRSSSMIGKEDKETDSLEQARLKKREEQLKAARLEATRLERARLAAAEDAQRKGAARKEALVESKRIAEKRAADKLAAEKLAVEKERERIQRSSEPVYVKPKKLQVLVAPFGQKEIDAALIVVRRSHGMTQLLKNGNASKSEAEKILRSLGAYKVYERDQHSVSGDFGKEQEVTLWVGSYGKTDRYGVRFGKNDGKYWGSNDTYFEITR